MSKRKITHFVYMASWTIMESMYVFNIDSIISTLLLGVIFLMSFYHIFQVLKITHCNAFFKSLTILLSMFTIYGLLNIWGDGAIIIENSGYLATGKDYLIKIYKSLLPIFSFYYFYEKGELSKSELKRWVLVWLLLSVGIFIRNDANLLLAGNDDRVTNNVGYLLLAFMSSVLLFDKKLIQYLLILIIMMFVIIAVKRGAMLLYPFCLLVYLSNVIQYSDRKHRLFTIICAITVIIMFGLYLNYRYNQDYFLRYRLELSENGYSSSRDVIYEKLWNTIKNEDDICTLLLGNGANSTIKICGNLAHNDWLEIIVNQGLLGLIVYLNFWLSLVKLHKKSKRNQQVRYVFAIFLVIYLGKTFFSMSYSDVPLIASCMLGISIAEFEQGNNCYSIHS